MKVANGVEMLEISANVMGRASAYNPTLIFNDQEAILVDAGFPGQAEAVRKAIERAVAPFDRLSRVIITHQDIDHIGGLADLVKAAPQKVEVLASAGEKPYIEGEKPLVKMKPEVIARIESMLPPEVAEGRRRALRAVTENPPRANVDRTVADAEIIDCCGGITVIAVPGHTPGHICLYLQEARILVAGDAMVVSDDGQLMGPNEQVAYDIRQATESLRKLAGYDIEKVICYHGGLYEGGANERIATLAAGGLSPIS